MLSSLVLATVFLNGVNIEGLRGQSFEKCKAVKIDDKGDIYLDCPGYQVEAAPAASQAQTAAYVAPAAPAAAAAPASITKHYWLVTEQSEKGAAQYDLDLWINSKWVRKFRAGEDQVVLDVTKYLMPGQNKLIFGATKRLEGGRKSASPSAFIKAIVGEGEAGGQSVMIDTVLVEVKRTAAELDNRNEEFTVNAR